MQSCEEKIDEIHWISIPEKDSSSSSTYHLPPFSAYLPLFHSSTLLSVGLTFSCILFHVKDSKPFIISYILLIKLIFSSRGKFGDLLYKNYPFPMSFSNVFIRGADILEFGNFFEFSNFWQFPKSFLPNKIFYPRQQLLSLARDLSLQKLKRIFLVISWPFTVFMIYDYSSNLKSATRKIRAMPLKKRIIWSP